MTQLACRHGHAYLPENTYVSPSGRRGCRACVRASQQRYKASGKTLTVDVFVSKVEPLANGCWQRSVGRASQNYARLNGQSLHRWTYSTFIGPIPAGLDIDHLCRNRRCVNPLHLEAVTHRVNLLRGVGFAALRARAATCKRGHPLSGANVRFQKPLKNGQPRRNCQTCANARSRELRARRRPSAEAA